MPPSFLPSSAGLQPIVDLVWGDNLLKQQKLNESPFAEMMIYKYVNLTARW